MSPILEFHNIVRSFKPGVPVLDGVTFGVSPARWSDCLDATAPARPLCSALLWECSRRTRPRPRLRPLAIR